MSDIIVIEPGSEGWAHLVQAVRVGKKLSIQDRGEGRYALKVSEFMWSPTLGGPRPVFGSGPGFEPPANG